MSDIATLAEAKAYARIGESIADTAIQTLLDCVEDFVASLCGTAFEVIDKEEYLDGGFLTLRPSLQPLISITGITDMHADETEVDEDDYRIIDDSIYYGDSGSAPGTWPAGVKRYFVEYKAGYNDGTATPPTGSVAAPSRMKLFILGMFERAYKARGGVMKQGAAATYTELAALDVSDLSFIHRLCDLRRTIH